MFDKFPDTRRHFLRKMASGALALSTMRSDVFANSAKANRLRIGQIGVGHAHATKLGVYRDSADYEVVGIVEPDDNLREAAQSKPVYRDLPWLTQEQLLNWPGLDAVLVETQVRDSLAAAEACIAAGKHIHLDKPAGESMAVFRRLVRAAEAQQLMIQMGYMYRYNPGVIMLRQFLERGWLGDVFEVHAVMSKVVPPAIRVELAEYPGGIMFELGCHVMDLVIGVLGKPQSVTPFAQTALHPHQDDLVDNMLAVLTYDHALATVKSSALEVEGFDRRHLVVCGTEGTLQIQPLDNPSVRLALSTKREDYRAGYQEIPLPRYTRYVADAADMAAVLRGDRAFGFSYQHDLDVQESLLKACRLPT